MRRLTATAVMTVLLHVGAGVSVAQPNFPFSGYGMPHSPSGMLLGIYAYENPQGLCVTGTVPGYSAHGRLQSGDILLRATTDNLPCYNISTRYGMEYAKQMIGVGREAAIEFFRPGVGNMYAWVTFIPVNSQLQGAQLQGTAAAAQPTQFQAVFKLESEQPGAQALFEAAAAPAAGETTAPATETAPAAAPAETPAQPAAPEAGIEAPGENPAPADPSSGDDELDSLFN